MDNPDRRHDPRIDAEQPVTITVLADPNISVPGRLTNLSGRGARLELDRDIPPGTPIQIDLPDTLFLGEVVYSRPADTRFQVGVELQHALYHTADLAKLARRLLSEAVFPASAQ